MVGFGSMADLVTECETNGKMGRITFYKSAFNAAVTIAATGFELLSGTGQPGAVTFSGTAGVATAMNSSTSGALPINGNVSTDKRYLLDFQINSATTAASPITFYLCDCLLYYPNININASPTALDNTVTLPRYTNGVGVQAVMLTTTALTTSAPTATFTYTDSGNNSTTGALIAPSATAPRAQLWTSNTGGGGSIFLPMGSSGVGIKSIASYTLGAGTAVGAATVMLVKPLVSVVASSVRVAQEKDFVFQFTSLPEILDGACLGIIGVCGPALPVTSIFKGEIRYGWG